LYLLGLASTPINDLSPITGLTQLQSLDLSDTHVSDLSPLTNLKCLEELDLTGTEIRDLTLLTQGHFPGLKRLTIGGDMPQKQITALEAQLPNCNIEIEKVS